MNFRYIHLSLSCLFVFHHSCFAAIMNYEGSEALERAKALTDRPQEEMTLEIRDQIIAEYERYLEENPDTLNRANVYSVIGSAYKHYQYGPFAEKNHSYDRAKAEEYWRRSISVDPNYISTETIKARTNLTSSEDSGERLKNWVNFHKWAVGVTDQQIEYSVRMHIDAESRQRGASKHPDAQAEIAEKVAAETTRLRKDLTRLSMDLAMKNALGGARDSDDPLGTLASMRADLEGYPGAAMVEEAIQKFQAKQAAAEQQPVTPE